MKNDRLIWFVVFFFQVLIIAGLLLVVLIQSIQVPTSAEMAEYQRLLNAIQSGHESLTVSAQANLLFRIGKMRESFIEFSTKLRSGFIDLIEVLAVCILLEGWLCWKYFRANSFAVKQD
jgi:uncharacterized membrane protein (DUF106 family)